MPMVAAKIAVAAPIQATMKSAVGACVRREEEDEHDAEHDAPVADAVRDESLLRSVARLLAVSVVADEKVRAEADALPTDEHQQKIVRQHERQHHEHEEVEVGEEA